MGLVQKHRAEKQSFFVWLYSMENRYWRTVICCALVASCIFVPLAIVDGGFFRYAGDFNSQQITFYTYMNAFVKEGGSFSWATDLGSGALNTYSYYLYGSPVFWLSVLFPQNWIPYLMAPMLILKIAFSGGGAYLYLQRYAKNKDFAVIAACLYALSGFTIYNVFFNSFLEVILLFPYLLWALDATIYDNKHGWFAFFIALNFLNNYFFFVGQVLFICIYFFCKVAYRAYHITGKVFVILAIETLLGAGMGMLMAWPAFLSIMQNPRTVNFASGYGFLMYHTAQQYFAIVLSWFMPPDSPYLSSFWDTAIVKWTSLSTYLPLCSVAGVLAYWKTRGDTWVKRVLFICMICALVPVLNSAFYALNSSFYARWYYMPLLIMTLASMNMLEEIEVSLHKFTLTVGIWMLLTAAFAIVPVHDSAEDTWTFGVLQNSGQYFLVLFLGILGLVLFAWVNEYWRNQRTYCTRLLAVVMVFSFVYGMAHISVGKFAQWESDKDLDNQYWGAMTLAESLPDSKDYRIDTYETYDNLAMWMDMSGLQHFNTTVAPSILEFYPTVGVKRDVSSKPEYSLYALRSLLGVRYTIMPAEQEELFLEQGLKAWERGIEQEGFVVYENKHLLPLAYTYDHYITQEQADKVSTNYQANLLLRGILLDEEQIDALAELDITALTILPDSETGGMTYDNYKTDVATRATMACDDFTMTKDGFVTNITLSEPNLLFVAVPYDDGFTAMVNGIETEVWSVDNGLTAIPCVAGENEVVVTYQADGFAESQILFLGSFGCYLLYVVSRFLVKRCTTKPDQPAEQKEKYRSKH